ncbi:MAG TPA: SPOR domain-containing protein [Candidatus Omnitrophota bacterium]|nr:SPOR domain-containing protein [Candidatus Omnitrophota bacterium]
MAFFIKKKLKNSQISTLSESEIQKKLYGEFNAGDSEFATNERGSVKPSGVEPSFLKNDLKRQDEKEKAKAAPDLFNVSQDNIANAIPAKTSTPESKSVEIKPPYVPPRDFDKKAVLSNSPKESIGVPKVYAHRLGEKGRTDGVLFFEKIKVGFLEFFSQFSNYKHLVSKKLLFSSAVILVVVMLFWSVSVLNSQREEAMKGRYRLAEASRKITTNHVEANVSTQAAAAPLGNQVTKPREVVITPVQMRRTDPSETKSETNRPNNEGGHYVIQVVTYPSIEDAQKVVDALKRDNLKAFLKENKRPSGRVFYIVMIGGFSTETEAQAQLLKFRAKEIARPFQDAFVKISQ